VHAGERVLDIPAGSHNAALAAARRGAQVTAAGREQAAGDPAASAGQAACREAARQHADLGAQPLSKRLDRADCRLADAALD